MAVNIGTLQAFIVADNSGLLNSVRQANAAMATVTKRAADMSNRVASSFTNVGRSLTVGVTLPVAGAAAAMVKAASDAEETANKFSVVFSGVRGEASAMAEALRADFGLARTEARQLLADTGDLLSGFGFTQEAALDLSNQVNTLAADLASFTNLEGGTTRASEALTKALLGERESIKSLGIAILDADVKAKVLQLRQQGMTFETDRQAAAYATLQLALAQSKNAIGDFARSQESTANQARTLWARVKDVSELLGTALIPTVNRLLGEGIKWLDVFSRLNPEIQSMAVQIALVAAAAGPASLGLGAMFKAVSFGLGGVSALLGVLSLVATPLGLIATAGAAATAALVAMVGPVDVLAIGWQVLEDAWSFWVERFRDGVNFLVTKAEELGILTTAADLIGKAWVGLRTVFSLVLSGIGTAIGGMVRGLEKVISAGVFLAEKFKLTIPAGIRAAQGALNDFSEGAFQFGEVNAQVAAETAMEWDTAFESLKATGATFTRATREAFTTLVTTGGELLDMLRENSAGKAAEIQAVFDRLKNSIVTIGAEIQGVQVTPGGVGLPDVEGGGGGLPTADTELAESTIRLQKWFDENAATLENFRLLAVDTFTSFSKGFSDAVASAVMSGKSFRAAITGVLKSAGSAIISQLVEMTIAQVALSQTATAGKAAAAAPHPFLIPVFVGIGLAAFAAAISSTDGSSAIGGAGGGGGGGAAISAPVAAPTGPGETTVLGMLAGESGVEGEGALGGSTQTVRVVIDDEARGNLMTLIVDETKNGVGDGSGDVLALERT